MNPLRIILLAGAGVIVGVGVVLGVTGTNPFDLLRPPAKEASVTPQAGTPSTDSRSSRLTKEPKAAPAAEVVPPAFSVVRVEPDGSLVVAGTAASQAVVDLMTGTRSLGNAKAGANGDFAIVLDEPLKPGDYQLVLRATAPDGTVAASPETAVVSVPDTADGQVLALVEKPGEPSRLITKPEPAPASKPVAETASEPAASGSEQAADAAAAKPEPTAKAEEMPVAGADGEMAKEESKAEMAEKPAEPEAGEIAAGKPAEAASTETATGTEPAKPAAQTEDKVAMAKPETAGEKPADAKPAAAAKPNVRVEAVEIEGRSVFVAGQGTPGMRVRVYANEILLGIADVSPAGRFLVETERDLPVGDYIIRADMLEVTGTDVIARAAVPFERQAGESIAAVAPNASETAPQAEQGAAEPASSGPATAEAGGAPTPKSEPARESASEMKAGAEAPASQPAATSEPTATGEEAEQKSAMAQPKSASGPEAVVAPKLEATGGSVIIRRGDTLWQISRRVYGRGIRYSTIYLANQEQIADPDRIWPGQIFQVPGETEEGETADMSTVKSLGDNDAPKN